MKVLAFGALNIDYVYEVDHIMQKGETQLAMSRNVYAGGKGLNLAIALGRAGVKTFLAGNIGTDGAFMLEMLQDAGVDTSLIQMYEKKPCGHTVIQKDKQGDNCIMVYGGANQCVTQTQVDHVLNCFEPGDLIVLQNEINQLEYMMERAHQKGMIIVLNASPFDESLKKMDLSQVDYLFVNEVEVGTLAGSQSQNPEDLACLLRNQFEHQHVILTAGSRGAWYVDSDDTVFQESNKVKVIDTTAAGDTFMGYFLSGLVNEEGVKDSMKKAAKAAAITVGRKGAAPSIPFAYELMMNSE